MLIISGSLQDSNETVNPRGGGTLLFSYIPRLGPFFGVQNLGFQKNDYFLGV